LKGTEGKLVTVNPTSGQILNEYENMTKENINELVRRAREAFSDWKKDIQKRADSLYAFADEIRKNKENLAVTATREMGKAIKESRSEIDKCLGQ